VSFRIVTANQRSAGGGTIGSSGTFRVGNYNPSGTPTPFTINGTLMAAPVTAVPEPSAALLVGFGLTALFGARRFFA